MLTTTYKWTCDQCRAVIAEEECRGHIVANPNPTHLRVSPAGMDWRDYCAECTISLLDAMKANRRKPRGH